MADLNAGDAIPELRVTPDKYLPHRYAGASGDFNPIHIDPEFAKAVGLPSNILHGLYSMGLVAKAPAQGLAGGDPRALKQLSVQFRGMGLPEQEIVVTGTVKAVDGDRVVVDTEAAQGDNRIIRNATGRARALAAGLDGQGSPDAGGRRLAPPRASRWDAYRAPGTDSCGWWSTRYLGVGAAGAVERGGRAGRRSSGVRRPCAPSWPRSRRRAT